MVHVTQRARAELCGMLVRALESRGASDEVDLGFRLAPAREEPNALGLRIDASRAGDAIVEHDGRSVLIVDPNTANMLEGLTLDLVETPDGERLSIRK